MSQKKVIKEIIRRNYDYKKRTNSAWKSFKRRNYYPLGLSITQAAIDLGVSRKALSALINEHSSLSPEMAIRIARATNTTPESSLNMQNKLDLWKAEQKNPQIIPFPEFNNSYDAQVMEG